MCEGRDRRENADGGRIHSQDKHGKLPVEPRARPLCGRELTHTHTHKVNIFLSWIHAVPFVSQLSLCKTSEVWWNAVLKGEEEIDVNKINRERSMATVDEEEHAVLDRLTFDYHQKLQGKPQSHEMVRP